MYNYIESFVYKLVQCDYASLRGSVDIVWDSTHDYLKHETKLELNLGVLGV